MKTDYIKQIVYKKKPIGICAIKALVQDSMSCNICIYRHDSGLCIMGRYLTNTLGVR